MQVPSRGRPRKVRCCGVVTEKVREMESVVTQRRRRARVPYEARLFRRRLSPDEDLEVSAMLSEQQTNAGARC